MDKVAYLFVLINVVCAQYFEGYPPSTDGLRRIEVNGETESDSSLPYLSRNKRDYGFGAIQNKPGHQSAAAQNHGKSDNGFYDFLHYPSYNEIMAYLYRLARLHEGVRVITIGKSYERRDILGIEITNGDRRNPILFIEAGIHGREWLVPTTALFAIRSFISDRAKFPNTDIIIIPVLNPDGYEYSRTTDRMWRKNRSKNSQSSCEGVDLNRNFDIKWKHRSQSRKPCDETYSGPAAFSEPETQALKNFFERNWNRIKIHITMHSPVGSIMYPGGVGDSQAQSKKNILSCLAQSAVSVLTQPQNTVYKVGPIDRLVGVAAGDSAYWSMIRGGSETSFVLELPGKAYRMATYYGFHLPEKYIIPIGTETYQMLSVFGRYAQTGKCSSKSNTQSKVRPNQKEGLIDEVTHFVSNLFVG
ncbi:hypothetical protein QAD02_019109 [Eretmocerus hayati]|uniref:Uncharacterized protein n=1 Tax=Eretmocerus hayati TaxID=131215 RepID=A0ACC2PIW9_9HYME|nr:hypothetical protein QAD02_019109 [Eretmocerus hayati]